jgi:hypothetical protein
MVDHLNLATVRQRIEAALQARLEKINAECDIRAQEVEEDRRVYSEEARAEYNKALSDYNKVLEGIAALSPWLDDQANFLTVDHEDDQIDRQDESLPSNNGTPPQRSNYPSRNAWIKAVILTLRGTITQPIVKQRLVEIDPDASSIEGTTISKMLRELAESGEIELESRGGGGTEITTYVRI